MFALLAFSGRFFDLVKQVGGINNSQKAEPLAKLLRFEICCGHQIQEIFVAADQIFCARSDREIDIGFIVLVARVFKDSNFPSIRIIAVVSDQLSATIQISEVRCQGSEDQRIRGLSSTTLQPTV